MNNYFPHDSNARNSDKIIPLRSKMGAEGYGIYFMILERLREEPNYTSIKDYNMLAFDLRVDAAKIKTVIEGFGLFVFTDDGKYFYSESFLRRMQVKESKSKKALLSVAQRWGQDPATANSKKRSERLSSARQKGSHTKQQWDELRSFFGCCVACGKGDSEVNLVKDHIIPIYQGGSDGIDNIQPLCKSCSSKKGSNITDYRIAYCNKIGVEFPDKWLPNAYETPTKRLRNAYETPTKRLRNAYETPTIKESKVKENKDNISSNESILSNYSSSSTPIVRVREGDANSEFVEKGGITACAQEAQVRIPESSTPEKSCAKKVPPIVLPDGTYEYIPITAVAGYLKSDQCWLDVICMNRHLRMDYVLSKIDEFAVELRLQGETAKDKRDCRRHFNNWLRKNRISNESTATHRASNGDITNDEVMRRCQERVYERLARAEAREMGQDLHSAPDPF